MELRQLEYFLAAAQTQNFRQAAELCLITQPALSRQIASLEQELGIILFERVKQRVLLTPAGHAFIEYAKSALDALHEGEKELLKWRQGEHGTILIGCNPSLATAFLPPLLTTFHHQYPSIHIKVQVHSSDTIIKLVEQGKVDLGFIYDPTIHSELVVIKELFRQPLQLLLSKQHPLFVHKEQGLTLANIVQETILMLGETTRLHNVLKRVFLQRGYTIKPAIEIDSIEGLKEMVKQGCGITIIPEALLQSQSLDSQLALLPITDLTESFLFALVYRRIGHLHQAAHRFIKMIQQQISPETR